MKLEAYLRMADIEHAVSILKGQSPALTGKAPYIEEDGCLLTDSGLIINHLERTEGHPAGGALTLAQRVNSLALRRLM
jgi:glutathione S-transferase